MTDNRTTELREKLTERGIEYTTNDHMGAYETSWNGFTAMQLTPGAKLLMVFTPDQAIAATVGSGTLTAEQVREAIMSVDRWEKPMGSTGLTNTHLIIRDDGWQAIADELNATVGNGTCHMDFIDEYERPSGDEDYLCECSECGSQMWEPAHDLPLYCRKCGKKVE